MAAAAELSRRYPEVAVDEEVLYVGNGQVLTSAGVAAGLDLCLHMIQDEHPHPEPPHPRADRHYPVAVALPRSPARERSR